MIFLDTSDLDLIRKFNSMGIIRGVTTNPSILLSDKVVNIESRIKSISSIIYPYPVFVEVTSTNYNDVIDQAKTFSSWGENVMVKVTIHGENGEIDNLKIIHDLEKIHNIRINTTAMMSAQQCVLAALAGSSYLSIFGGRVNNMGYNVCGELTKLRKLLDMNNLSSKIIVGSTREVLNIVEWLEAGAHIVTVTPKLLEGMIVHPYTKETVQMFFRDIEKMNKEVQ